jgi:hypothetical protein
MKKYLFLLLVFVFTLPMISQNKFVGVKGCACHNLPKQGKQVEVWKKSKHADAFNTLKSEEAKKYMAAKGLKGEATEAKECLDCHTTGYGEAAEKTFSAADGVQCEACHGAASGYKNLHNKPENKEKAVAAGMITNGGEKLCVTCHVSKMHDVKKFDFKKMMEEIKHPTPKG